MKSTLFKVSQLDLLKAMFMMRLRRGSMMRFIVILASISIITLMIVGILIDYLWIVVDLMFIFLIIPMIMTFLYINDALFPGTFFNTLPHTIDIKDGKILINIEIKNNSVDTGIMEQSETQKNTEIKTIEFKCADIEPFYAGLNNITLPIGKKGIDGMILVPAKVFINQEKLMQFINEIYDNTYRKEE